ncbi:serine hydrolase [Cohnella faecalis]|nr:serine hydrolase [Cohnella faecalis]
MKRTAACVLATALALGIPAASASYAGFAAAAESAAKTDSIDSQNASAFLDRFFEQEDVKRQASAIAVSIVKDGKVLAERGYGFTDDVSNAAVDPGLTTFRIASVSKVFTVFGLMQLVDQGKVSLQDNIEKYLGGYKVVNPFGKPVTVEMLLTHTTGFEVREPTNANFLLDPSQKPGTLEEAIFASFPPVVREPGTSYMYDNFASELAGYLVEKISGEPFNDYMTKHVFQPLGMTSTSYLQTEELLGRLPTAYDGGGSAVPVYRLTPSVIPEGSMITTAQDVSRFMLAFLNGGTAADGKSILSPSSVKAMSTFHVAINADVPDIAYGFEAPPLLYSNGRNVITKDGAIPGFSSFMWLLPEEKTGVFVTYNTNSGLSIELFREFMNRYYPGQTTFGDAGYKARPQSELKRFEGIYSDLRYGRLTSVRADADGTLSAGNSAGVFIKLKQSGELLFVDELGNPFAFKLDDQGNVDYLKYSNPGSYAAKLPKAAGFPDVPEDHPYAKYIHGLQAMGLLTADPAKPIGAENPVTREQFVHEIVREFGLPAATGSASFRDVAASPYGADIQAALELGLLNGTGNGYFRPERPIKREEAAVIVRRLLEISGVRIADSQTALAPGTSKWAETSVKALIDFKIHGPEVSFGNGQANYGSQKSLNVQELAAIMFLLQLPEVSLIQ